MLRTYCSGAVDSVPGDSDLDYARLVAAGLGSAHVEAPVSRELFGQRWNVSLSPILVVT